MDPKLMHQELQFFSPDNNSYIWVTSFGEQALKEFTKSFLALESDPSVHLIPIIISSNGGSVHNCLAMRDLIKTSNKDVATIAFGKALSAGAYLLAAGTKGFRFVAPNATIMIHEVQSGVTGSVAELEISLDEVKRLNSILQKNLATDTGKSITEIKTKLSLFNRGDWFMTPEEAVLNGLADQIEMPRPVEEIEQPVRVRGLVSFTPPVVNEPTKLDKKREKKQPKVSPKKKV